MIEQIAIIIAGMAFILVGFSAKRLRYPTIAEFSTNRDALSWFVTMAGVSMTFVGGAALVTMASLGYTFAWQALIDPVSVFIGLLVAILLVSRYRADKGTTMAQMLSSEYRPLALYIGIVTSTVFLLITSAQYVALSKLVSPYFPGIPPLVMMLVPSVIITAYVFVGGFSAVTKTDVFQMAVVAAVLLLPVGCLAVFGVPDGFVSTPPIAPAQMPVDLMILLGISLLYIPISQDINIRAKSARTASAAAFGFFGGAVVYSAVVVSTIYMGVTLAKHGVVLADPEAAYATFFKNVYPSWGVLAVVGGMAAIWSTLDTYLVNTITSVAEDVFRKSRFARGVSDRVLVFAAGVIVFAASMMIAVYFFKVLELVLTALLIYISVLIPIACGRKLKMNDRIVLLASLVTVAAILICEYLKLPVNPKAIIYPAAGVVVMVCAKGVSVLLRPA